jgi:hypothetical protein
MLLNKYSDFGGGKKRDSEFLSYNLIEGSGDRIRSPAGPGQSPDRWPREALGVWGITDIYLNDNFEPTILTLVLSEKIFLNEKKPHRMR